MIARRSWESTSVRVCEENGDNVIVNTDLKNRNGILMMIVGILSRYATSG